MAVPSDRERNLVQELARVITQAIPYEKSAPPDNHFREQTASGGYDEEPGLPRAPQLTREQACELHDDSAYAVHYRPCTAKKAQQKETLPVRRTRGSVIAIVGLAFFGATGAFGYRGMFSGSALPMPPPTITSSIEPHKIPLASDAPQVKTGRKANQAGADITGSIEKLVSREEQPVTIEPPKPAPRSLSLRVGLAAAPIPTNAAVAAATDPWEPPPTVAVASQRVGQPVAADVTGAARAQVGAVSTGPAEANSPAAAPPGVIGSGYAVQVTSERSASNAQAALLALRAKYANQLSGRQLIIRRADLGAKGTYYRVFAGPFASGKEAARWCSKFKAAGGNCIVQTS